MWTFGGNLRPAVAANPLQPWIPLPVSLRVTHNGCGCNMWPQIAAPSPVVSLAASPAPLASSSAQLLVRSTPALQSTCVLLGTRQGHGCPAADVAFGAGEEGPGCRRQEPCLTCPVLGEMQRERTVARTPQGTLALCGDGENKPRLDLTADALGFSLLPRLREHQH